MVVKANGALVSDRATVREIMAYAAKESAVGHDKLLLRELQWAHMDLMEYGSMFNGEMMLRAFRLRLAHIEQQRAQKRDESE